MRFLALEGARAAASEKREARDRTRGGMDMPPDDGVAHETLDATEAAVSLVAYFFFEQVKHDIYVHRSLLR